MTLPSSGGSDISIHFPSIHWQGTSATFITCALAIFVLWRWTEKWDHRIHIVLGIIIGILLTVTNVGAGILTAIHTWTHGQLG